MADDDEISVDTHPLMTIPPVHIKAAHMTVSILVIVNLLNYMDRFTIAGIPNYVKDYYGINEEQLGLLQTVFFISYTALSPVAGYFGDRWHRKYIMMIGLTFWISVTLVSSFIPSDKFILFLLARCLVGVGEASYSTIAPTIISDLFAGRERTKYLGIFYFAVPVGSAFGYIVGSSVTQWSHQWQWSLRVTPILGIGCALLLFCLHKDPPRGQAEGATMMQTTSWFEDLHYLFCNRAFLLVSAGFTCVCFILGDLTWFGVHLIQMGIDAAFDDSHAWEHYDIPLIFGATLMVAGVLGVLSGAFLGRWLIAYYPNADAVICATSQFIAAPLLYFALLTPTVNLFVCLFLIFAVDALLCVCWALVSDMTMSVIVPNRRATASAIQMIMTHALGDCISPTIVGAISVAISDSQSLEMKFLSLQRALFLNPFVGVLGAIFFSISGFYIVQAKQKVLETVIEIRLLSSSSSNVTTPSSTSIQAADV